MRRIYTLPLAAFALALGVQAFRAQNVGHERAQTAPDTTAEAPAAEPKDKKPMSFLDFKTESLTGKPVDLSQYKGKVILVINTASKCGNTPQYDGLEKLYKDNVDKGLVIIGFPANNFGGQEPGTNAEIGEFCQKNYGVTFPMMAKTSVKGDDQSPIFAYLTKEANPELTGDIDWNFAKFLISRDGELVARFKSRVQPNSVELGDAIKAELAKGEPAKEQK
ncbi:glutathione peroxidase BsaA [Abditibacteriota bacterium]|nr:glutathione peroxidase BsaA [Abditibacteriota bacterium]